MRDYNKPFIIDEEIEIEDICNVSAGGEGTEQSGSIWDDLTPEDE